MHFHDRTLIQNPPIAIVNQLSGEEKQKWLDYKAYKEDNNLPVVKKPSGKWTDDAIRKPLMNFFYKNCCYCGIYTDDNHQGEVDHHFPKELDVSADKIYLWENYVWSCHSCNNKKRSHYPVLDPCVKTEMDALEYIDYLGKYKIKDGSNQDLKDKFKITHEWTFINGHNIPKKRIAIHDHMIKYHLPRLKEACLMLDAIKSKPKTEDYKTAVKNLDSVVNDMKVLINQGDCIMLIKKIYSDFQAMNPIIHLDFKTTFLV